MTGLNISRVLTDEQAVSSVVSVILMVAVTVILAGAVGALALGIVGNPSTETTPAAKFEVVWGEDGGTDTVEIELVGGETLQTEEVSVTLGSSVVWTHSDGATGGMSIYDSQNWTGSEIAASETLGLEGSMTVGDPFKIVWTKDDKSQFLLETSVE